MDSLDQGARDIPVETITVKGNTVRLEVKTVQGVYAGALNDAGNKMTGTWKQGGQSLPLTLERSQGTEVASEPEPLSPPSWRPASRPRRNWPGFGTAPWQPGQPIFA